MNPQALVATILAIGVMLIILSGTPARFLWMPVEPTMPRATTEELTLWKDMLLVIIGALAGYVSGKGPDR